MDQTVTNDYRRVLVIMLLANLVGSLLIFSYFAYVDVETHYSNIVFWQGSNADWVTFAGFMLLFSAAATVLSWWYSRPIMQWEQRILAGETNVPRAVLQRTAVYPLVITGISFAGWLMAGLFFSQGGLTPLSTTLGTFSRTFVGITLIGGLLTSTIVFFAVDTVWRRHLPTFFPNGRFRDLNIRRITVGQRLTLAFLLIGIVPLLVLGASSRNSVITMMGGALSEAIILNRLQITIFFIVSFSLLTNLILIYLTRRNLLRPLRRLTTGMNRLADGDLHVNVPITTNDELGDLTGQFNEMVERLHQSQQMRDLFGRYVSREVAEQVLQKGAALGGESVAATALFADIRGFTSLSERLPAQQVVDMLNRYYTRMVDVIAAEGGMVNKFGGDSLLAIFGVPISQPDHALRALRAAEQMMRALAGFNAEQVGLGLPTINIGIGISSGEMVAGNIGGASRLEYTVIGDPVNLASRLESLTKELGQPVLVSEDTCRYLNGRSPISLQPCQQIKVRGKQQPTLVYSLQPS